MAKPPLGHSHSSIILIVWRSRLKTSRAIPSHSLPPCALVAVTSIVTFLMVFLIQNTQSRTRAALQLKLDELIRSTSGAHNVMLTLEDLSLEEIETFRTHYEKLAMAARENLRRGQADTSTPEIIIG